MNINNYWINAKHPYLCDGLFNADEGNFVKRAAVIAHKDNVHRSNIIAALLNAICTKWSPLDASIYWCDCVSSTADSLYTSYRSLVPHVAGIDLCAREWDLVNYIDDIMNSYRESSNDQDAVEELLRCSNVQNFWEARVMGEVMKTCPMQYVIIVGMDTDFDFEDVARRNSFGEFVTMAPKHGVVPIFIVSDSSCFDKYAGVVDVFSVDVPSQTQILSDLPRSNDLDAIVWDMLQVMHDKRLSLTAPKRILKDE